MSNHEPIYLITARPPTGNLPSSPIMSSGYFPDRAMAEAVAAKMRANDVHLTYDVLEVKPGRDADPYASLPAKIVSDIEPPEGSVLMTQSTSGTAFQRFYSDGLYHGPNGKTLTYDDLLGQFFTPLVVYVPPQD